MNEQKHTPGHWYATSGYVAVKTQNGHRVICSMSRTDSCMNYAAGVGSTEDASNARLIAAAPDMLAALKIVRDAYQDMFDNMPVAWQTIDNYINAAIKQAEG
jgi:hypothetical protein